MKHHRRFAERREETAIRSGETSPEASIQDALDLARAWADLDWGEAEAELDRIRHQSNPTPPMTDL